MYTGLLQIKEIWQVASMFLSADVYPTVYRTGILKLNIIIIIIKLRYLFAFLILY